MLLTGCVTPGRWPLSDPQASPLQDADIDSGCHGPLPGELRPRGAALGAGVWLGSASAGTTFDAVHLFRRSLGAEDGAWSLSAATAARRGVNPPTWTLTLLRPAARPTGPWLGVAAHCLEQTRCPLPVTDFLPGPQEPEKGHFWHHSKCRQLAGCRPLTGVSPVAAWGQFDFSQSPFSPPPTAPLDNDEGHSDLEIDLHFDQRGSHRRRLRGPAAWAKAPVNGGL